MRADIFTRLCTCMSSLFKPYFTTHTYMLLELHTNPKIMFHRVSLFLNYKFLESKPTLKASFDFLCLLLVFSTEFPVMFSEFLLVPVCSQCHMHMQACTPDFFAQLISNLTTRLKGANSTFLNCSTYNVNSVFTKQCKFVYSAMQ